jgi:hypothetical protein
VASQSKPSVGQFECAYKTWFETARQATVLLRLASDSQVCVYIVTRDMLCSSMSLTKIPTSKRSYTVLPPRPPPTTPCGKLQKNLNLSRKLLQLFGRHRIHRHEAMLKKRMPSPITLPLSSNLTHLIPPPLPKPPSHHSLKPFSN